MVLYKSYTTALGWLDMTFIAARLYFVIATLSAAECGAGVVVRKTNFAPVLESCRLIDARLVAYSDREMCKNFSSYK